MVGSRISNWDINVVDRIADNASSGQFALGTTPKLVNSIDLELCGMTLAQHGEILSGRWHRLSGKPPAHAAARLVRTMLPASPDEAFEARIGSIGAVRAFFPSSA